MEWANISQNLDIFNLIDYLGLGQGAQTGHNTLKIVCPFHGDTDPSLVLWLDRQNWKCYGCHRRGDLQSLIVEVLGVNNIEAMILLREYNVTGAIERRSFEFRHEQDEVSRRKAREYFQTLECPRWELAHGHYLQRRGFSAEILTRFDVRLHERSDYSVIVPVWESMRRTDDTFRGYIRRLSEFGPAGKSKYRYSTGLPVSQLLFGPPARDRILVVEGALDVMRAVQNGYENTVGILGSEPTPEQIALLRERATHLYCGFDQDAAGARATSILEAAFPGQVTRLRWAPRVASGPERGQKQDIGNMSPMTFRIVLGAVGLNF